MHQNLNKSGTYTREISVATDRVTDTTEAKNKPMVFPIENDSNSILGLVLSGGGAKGVAYAGLYHALSEQKTIHSIRAISGASAGAMSASLIALGLSADDFECIVTQLKLSQLLESPLEGRASGARFMNILDLIYLVQINQLFDIAGKPTDPLNNKISSYFNQLKNHNVMKGILPKNKPIRTMTLADILTLANTAENLKKLDQAFQNFRSILYEDKAKTIPRQNSSFCFKDITKLRSHLTAEQQHRLKVLYICVTNVDTQQLITYSEQHQPYASLAGMVLASGAHPMLFAPAIEPHHGSTLRDGGILDNMPYQLIVDNTNIPQSRILCVALKTEKAMAATLEKIQHPHTTKLKKSDQLIGTLIGIKNFAQAENNTLIRQHHCYTNGTLLILNSLHINTTSGAIIPLTATEISPVINQAKNDTLMFLSRPPTPYTPTLSNPPTLTNDTKLDPVQQKDALPNRLVSRIKDLSKQLSSQYLFRTADKKASDISDQNDKAANTPVCIKVAANS